MTMYERGPEGDRSLAAVRERFQIPLHEAMSTQRAIRKVLPDPVDDALVLQLIEYALKAPTGSHGQNWEFVVVTDRDVKERLARQYRRSWALYRRAVHQRVSQDPAMGKVVGAVQWQVEHYVDIPVHVVACLKGSRAPWVPLPPFAHSSYYGSIYPSVQNLLLGARAVGLGASLITLPLWSSIAARRILGLPQSVMPACVVPLGWPRGRYGPTTRRPVGDVVHRDRYRNPFVVSAPSAAASTTGDD